MTPERWRRVDELFDQALRIAPADRESWLARECDGDAETLKLLRGLLEQDQRADRVGFLKPPVLPPSDSKATATWAVGAEELDTSTLSRRESSSATPDVPGFAPRAAIVAQSKPHSSASSPSLVRARLRELPIVYMLLLGIMLLWTHVVIGHDDATILWADALASITLGAVVVVLSGRREISSFWLRGIELGMTALLAGLVSLIQYRLILAYSMREDTMLAQLTLKNVVLLDCILIMTYGLYVPKSWQRAAYVVAPLAMLPFAILLLLVLQHPVPMGWLWRGWRKSLTPRFMLYSLDVMILSIVAAGSAFGARTITLLRRQVVEARQLGQYRLLRKLGAGGMGEVYLAEHQLLKRPCAVKLIRASNISDPRALKRFEREVRLTATLSHPNTIEVYDYGRTEDGTYYYVMEYLRGLNLEELVSQHGPLPPARVVYLLRQVCLALREAHAAGLIHRDIKPSNIFSAARGGIDDVAKLLDFGLVRPAATGQSAHLSDEGQILGTPLFMSPEQATGRREVDDRSDIYSLGAVAYYLLTGRPPFEGSGIGVLISHAHDPVVSPSSHRADIPDDVERVILRCLSKDPSDRFQTADEMEHALGRCASASDWDEVTAARWWRTIDTVPAPS